MPKFSAPAVTGKFAENKFCSTANILDLFHRKYFSTGSVFQNNKKMRKVEPQESFFDLEIKQKAVWCLHFNASYEQRSRIVQILFKILLKEFSPWLHWKWTKAFQSKFRNFYHSISSWYHFEIVLPKIFFQSLAQIALIPILAFLHNFPIVSFLNCA